MRPIATVVLTIFLAGCATVSKFQMEKGGSFESVRQRRTSDCGLISLIAVMNYWGLNVDLREAEAKLGPTPKGGYSLNELKQYAEKNGLLALIIPGTIEILSYHTSLGRPCIIVYKRNMNSNHSVVVLKVDDSNEESPTLTIMNPVMGTIVSISGTWLKSRWEPLGSPILLVARGESAR